jgi:hypothetical protein
VTTSSIWSLAIASILPGSALFRTKLSGVRAVIFPITIAMVVLALGACGGDDKPAADRTVVPLDLPSEDGVTKTIRGYLTALNDGDGKQACRLLDDRGKAVLIAFLPSDKAAIDCEVAVRRVRAQIVPVRRFKIEQVSVSGRTATANVKGTGRPYSSGVLLANQGDGWKISYPPGLQAKAGGAPPRAVPGVPLERD